MSATRVHPHPLTSVGIADQLAGALRFAGADLIFGVPGGGTNLDMVGALEAAGCRFILTHTETAATIMAGVAAELTGRPSASVVTRGPGAASAVNGIAQALLDRQPVLVIADCVTTADRDRVSHQRLDHHQMLGAATKASITVDGYNAAEAARVAVSLAVGGRPGPVHVDVDPSTTGPSPLRHVAPGLGAAGSLEGVRSLLAGARRPVVIAGVGMVAAGRHRRQATSALRGFAEGAGVPVFTTYKARGVVADSSTVAAGVATGATIEGPLLEQADLIIGAGLDPVELIPAPWPYAAPVVLIGRWPIDDSAYFGDHLAAELVGDLDQLFDELVAGGHSDWPAETASSHRRAACARLLDVAPPSPGGLTPQAVVTIARRVAPPGTVATIDAGAHMLAAVPLWEVEEPGELLISSGLATMGFALPAAVAAALVRPDRHVVCFTGDGGLGMALAELETLARLRLSVVVVVFNDASLSLIAVKQKAERHGGDRAVRYAPTDFAAIAAGCGLASVRVADPVQYEQALTAALTRQGPTLLDVSVDPSGYPAIMDAIRGGRRQAVSE
jgi:acetolactate synthase-1/2/3 large subunit